MEEKQILSVLLESKSFILGSVQLGEEDYMNTPIHFYACDFARHGFKGINTLNDIIKNVDKEHDIIEGVGVAKFQAALRQIIEETLSTHEEKSLILPLAQEEGPHKVYVVKMAKIEDSFLFMFNDIESEELIPGLNFTLGSSFKDKLTGLFNKETLETHLANRERSGFLCMFDLNKFKAINDKYGHQVGDQVLMLLGDYMRSIASNDEMFYHISGDEFVIVFLVNNYYYAESVITKIEQYLEMIGKTSLKHFEDFDVSASFGLLEIRNDDVFTSKQLMMLADLAMYQAKYAEKTLHYISYKDALNILKSGELEERVYEAMRKCSRI